MPRAAFVSIGLLLSLLCLEASKPDRNSSGILASSDIWPRASTQPHQVYWALTEGAEVPGLRIERDNDTLAWGQFFPDAKFEIITRQDTSFVPVAIYGVDTSCSELKRYMVVYPPTGVYRPALTYLIPIDQLPMLATVDCIARSGGPGLELFTVRHRRGHPTYVVRLEEDIPTGDIRLHCQTVREFSDGGYVVDGNIEIDTLGSLVRISTMIAHPQLGAPDVIAPAGGTLSFTPPADSFALIIDDEQFLITVDADSIHICPTRVYHDVLISTPAAPRLAPNSFGLLFDTTVLFEGYEHIPEKYRDGYRLLSRQERDSLVDALNRIEGGFVLLPPIVRPGLRHWDVHRRDSINLLVDTRVKLESGRRSWRPTLFFEYVGDRRAILRELELWEDSLGDIELVWIRETVQP